MFGSKEARLIICVLTLLGSFAVIMPEMAVRLYWSHQNLRFANG